MPFPLPRWPAAQRQPDLPQDRQDAGPPAQAAGQSRGGEREEDRHQRGREPQQGKRGAGARRWPVIARPPRWGARLACR